MINVVYACKFLWEKDEEGQWIMWVVRVFYFLRGFSEWLFTIGVYGVTRQLVTAPPPGLARLSELAMPFYLTHQQLLVPLVAACSWVPYLSKETRHYRSPILL